MIIINLDKSLESMDSEAIDDKCTVDSVDNVSLDLKGDNTSQTGY